MPRHVSQAARRGPGRHGRDDDDQGGDARVFRGLQDLLQGRLVVDGYLGDVPAFSPDERYLVAVDGPGPGWWGARDEDDEDVILPSDGGTYDLGTVCVHDLTAGGVSEHRLTVELPEGWRPDDPDAGGGGWRVVWGPAFRGERTFRLWLPDLAPLDLTLPLPDVVAVPTLHTALQRGNSGP
jgi:hypothetical protein